MRRKIILTAILVMAALCSAAQTQAPSIEVHFSPKGGCTEAVVEQLQAAQESVLVQAYSFTSVPIAKALVDAR